MSTALTHGALCNGIGGFSLAARQAGISTIWTCDTDPFCNTVSHRHFLDAHQYLDIYDVSHPQRPDIISAGYPCQPLSYAGQRRGAEDYRWLWPQVRRLLTECRPGWFLGENVAGHLSLGLDGVLADLEAEDYEAWPLVLPACALGAPHRRDRVWIIAHTHDRQPLRPPQALRSGWPTPDAGRAPAPYPPGQRCGQPDPKPVAPAQGQGPRPDGRPAPADVPYYAEPAHSSPPFWLLTQPPLCARNDGLSARLVRPDGGRDAAGAQAAPNYSQADPKHWARNTLKAAGNALVPQIPALFFQFIADYEAGLIS